MEDSHVRDDIGVLRRLAILESISAGILMYLELTGAIAAEDVFLLRHHRVTQRNLAGSLGATRYRVDCRGRAYHAKFPMMYCFHADSSLYMLKRYRLPDSAANEPEAVSVVARMARVAGRRRRSGLLPYLEALTAEARARDAAPVDTGEMRSMEQVGLGMGITV